MNATAGTAAGPQHLRALSRANEVRLARAELKRRIGDGEVSVSAVILECPWETQSMTVADLLMSQRRWGTTRCRRVLAQVPVPETKQVGALTQRQRLALAALVGNVRGELATVG